MNHIRFTSRAWAGFLTLLSTAGACGVGVDGPRIVVRRCAATLPPEIAPFFQSRLADLEERVVEPEVAWGKDPKLQARASWFYLRMDVKAKDKSVSARLAAAEAFPRREGEARELFKSLGLERQGGKLPWAVEDLHAQLVRAFQQGDEDEVVKTAAYLAHLAWAASQPFSVTMNHDGRDTGNLYLGDLAAGDSYYPHQSVHYRVMGELVRRCRNRYLEQVQVRPLDVQPVREPLEACFRQMLGALARLDDLLTADREIAAQLGATDGATLVKREDEYYSLLDARCGDIVVERLRAAAMLAANLITGAWEQAGRPVVGGGGPAGGQVPTGPQANPGEKPREKSPSTEPSQPVRLVGSKNSAVFHRSDCPHVQKISPSNLVYYASAEDAKRQGKRPCQVCKPE